MTVATQDTPKINLVAKDQLARMLARENINIRHDVNSPVSKFDSKTRTLTLPVWNKANEDIYDLLVAREVGRALHSPNENHMLSVASEHQPDNPKNYAAFLQTMEGIRVERKMKQDYPGLGRSFINGYRDLHGMGFFDVGVDVKDLSLADRIDLYSKVGQYGHIDIPFSNSEIAIRDAALAAESFDDVVNITRKIYYHRDIPDDPQGDGQGNGNEQGEGESQGESQGNGQGQGQGQGNGQGQGQGQGNGQGQGQGQGNGQGNGEGQGNGQGQDQGNDQGQDQGNGQGNGEGDGQGNSKGKGNGVTVPQTRGGVGSPSSFNRAPMINDKMNDKVQSLASNNKHDARNSYKYFHVPTMNTEKLVNPYSKIYKEIGFYPTATGYTGDKMLNNIEKRNRDFVTNLVQTFEQKMAADEARRQRVSRTGRLDMRRIANYKFDDNLFLKNTIVPNGKNHGMFMIIDWSGSMGPCLMQTIEQILAMVFFCRRMKIPYKVLAFADGCPVNQSNNKADFPNYGQKDYLTPYGQQFHEFLSSKMSNAEFRKNAGIFCQLGADIGGNADLYGGKQTNNVYSYGSKEYNAMCKYTLTGTPLNQAVYNSIDLVQRFRAENNLEIVNVFVLTDGGGASCIGYDYYTGAGNTILIDKSGRQHILSQPNSKRSYVDSTNELQGIVEYAKKTTGANYISIYLSRNATQPYGYTLPNDEMTEAAKCFRENNYYSYTEPRGYTESFVIRDNIKIADDKDMFDGLTENSTASVIANRFAKSLEKKRTSRVFLNRFADLIAKKVLV